MKVFAYRTEKDGECVSEGVIDYCSDVDIELLTGIDTSSDKGLWDVQRYLDKNHKGEKYVFQYRERDIDLDKLFGEKSDE